MSTVDWDAEAYNRLADPQEEWGLEVLARLELEGDETVLDAGCGSGRVTRRLLERLPRGKVIGVDAAPSMIAAAREAFDGDDRVDLRVCDLLELELSEPVDAIFSNATFHWILDHGALFARLFAALRPGGQLEVQFGGQGNVAEWKRAIEAAEGDERFSAYLRGMPDTHNFASPSDTEARLARAGFEVDSIWLEDRTVAPPEPREFVRVVGLAKHLAQLPADMHERFLDTVLGSMSSPLTLQYVRLNVSARRLG